MKDVRIRLLLQDSMGNRSLLDVSNDEFGILKYSLYSEISHTPLSLSNLQLKQRLPDTIDDYVKDVDADVLKRKIVETINGGVKRVIETVFSKCMR